MENKELESQLGLIAIEEEKPQSNVYTLLTIISFICSIYCIVYTANILNKHYDYTFGGLLKVPVEEVKEWILLMQSKFNSFQIKSYKSGNTE